MEHLRASWFIGARSTSHQGERSSRLAAAAAAWLADRLWLSLPLLALPALWPLYSEGVPKSSDGLTHLLRLGLLDYYLRHGMLFPRWMPDMLLGHGYPTLNFYASSTYYVAETLHLLGLTMYWAFAGTFALLVIAAGIGMFFMARALLGHQQRAAALLAAVAYMYAPYLLTNVYSRGAIAEVGAQALLPWIFWSVRQLILGPMRPRHLVIAAIVLGTLAFTHDISLILVPLVVLAYAAVLWRRSRWPRDRLLWVGLGFAFAVAISAFFWMPLLFERQYLADTADTIARGMLARSAWSWNNILGSTIAYKYGAERPVRLGLVQAILSLSGIVLARRRDSEWLFFGLMGLFFALLMGAWSLPLWSNSDILVTIQYLYRLLVFVSLPLALATAGTIIRLRGGWRRGIAASVLIVVIILANRPRVSWTNPFSPATLDPRPSIAAQLELDNQVETAAQQMSSVQEFRPRWAAPTLELDAASVQSASDFKLSVSAAGPYDLDLNVSGAVGGPLRFSTFYFPGWQVLLDGRVGLRPYPSTNLGLLTVDMPPGSHRLSLTWAGTGLQHAAVAVSLLALASLALVCLPDRQDRRLATWPVLLCLIGLAAVLWRPARYGAEVPPQPAANAGVSLVGLRWERFSPEYIYLYPYWYVSATPDASWYAEWQMVDARGDVVARLSSRPRYNAALASNWPEGTLISDAYELPLPSGLAAGTYRLVVRFGAAGDVIGQTPVTVGQVSLSSGTPLQPAPGHKVDIRFGDAVQLAGFDVAARGPGAAPVREQALVVRAGQYVDYTLYWGAEQPLPTNYHGFIHLTDAAGHTLTQQDQMPGPTFAPPLLWSAGRMQSDSYLLRIPGDAPSGLYWPVAGLYDISTMQTLPTRGVDGQALGQQFRMPPLKILGASPGTPGQPVFARFGDLATLIGYDLALPAPQVHPGDSFTLTLYYRSQAVTDRDAVRFVHLYSPSLGMAAQHDSQPGEGSNPTWAWVRGETVVDRVVLTVANTAAPGRYALSMGLYTPADGGARVPVTDRSQQPLPDSQVTLTPLDVAP